MKVLKNKKILLGVTGSIAAYKAVELTRRLTEEGASVHVIMTDASMKFVTPLTFVTVSRGKVFSGMFDDPLAHITLAADADLMLIAPATANIIGKFANGIADDLLSTTLLAFRGKVLIAPAMNWKMYENPVVQRNLQYLLAQGVLQTGPEKGSLACGEEAVGRMADTGDIMAQARSALSRKDLAGKKILITAGPTREYMDPVRFISNRSSGKMGFALAAAASRRGAEVTLVSGPACLKPCPDMRVLHAESASDMRDAVLNNIKDCDAVIMAAAVADFSPVSKRETKFNKAEVSELRLARTPDVLKELGMMTPRPFLAGFAAETGQDIGRARKKLLEKGADLIVFNDVMSPGSGFDTDTNEITLIERDRETPFPLMTKDEAADIILDRISESLLLKQAI